MVDYISLTIDCETNVDPTVDGYIPTETVEPDRQEKIVSVFQWSNVTSSIVIVMRGVSELAALFYTRGVLLRI